MNLENGISSTYRIKANIQNKKKFQNIQQISDPTAVSKAFKFIAHSFNG